MIWLVVSHIFHFHAYEYLRKWSNFIDIFQKGWNHHLVIGDARNSLDAEIMDPKVGYPNFQGWVEFTFTFPLLVFFWEDTVLVPEKTHKTGIFGDIFHILSLLIHITWMAYFYGSMFLKLIQKWCTLLTLVRQKNSPKRFRFNPGFPQSSVNLQIVTG